jgi:hypothetical protein
MKYDGMVRALNHFVLAFVAVAGGCHPVDPTVTCAPIRNVTRVEIRFDSLGKMPPSSYAITDPGQIHQVIAFANERREVSRPSLITMPAPSVTAVFSDKADFVAAIGSGSDFFFVSCSNGKGVRSATDAEIMEFKRLIGYSN